MVLIAELMNLGTQKIRIPRDRMTYKDACQARDYFLRALQHLRHDPQTSLKQVARTCHRLAESLFRMSILARKPEKQVAHAREAEEYGETSIINLKDCGDECMVAQVEFLLVCITAWRVYLRSRDDGFDEAVYHDVQARMENSLNKLRRYEELKVEAFERQRDFYLGYFRS
jgi:hypothetical protein